MIDTEGRIYVNERSTYPETEAAPIHRKDNHG